jgi:leucyl-tRNA synthetase
LFENGLIYREEAYVNWCPKCNTALANDQVIDGQCERDETEVVQKLMPQWFVKITDYADRLIEDLEGLDWPKETKKSQINWIGKREGVSINFETEADKSISVFTEKLETLNSIAGIRICPEHEILDTLVSKKNKEILEKYRNTATKKSNLEREHLSKDSQELSL